MARRKEPLRKQPATGQGGDPEHRQGPPPKSETTRRFLNRGVQVEIREAPGHVGLTLDGVPLEVTVDRGEYFAHEAHMFTGFGSIDALVDHLLANEGRTWSLHGHVCDERCRGGHHHGPGHKHPPGGLRPHPHGHAHAGEVPPDASAPGSRPRRGTRQPADRPSRKPPRRGGAR